MPLDGSEGLPLNGTATADMVSSLAASLHSGFYLLLEVFDPPESLASRNSFATFFHFLV
jgi:hypothetical protein